jgi:hypothetical protein
MQGRFHSHEKLIKYFILSGQSLILLQVCALFITLKLHPVLRPVVTTFYIEMCTVYPPSPASLDNPLNKSLKGSIVSLNVYCNE